MKRTILVAAIIVFVRGQSVGNTYYINDGQAHNIQAPTLSRIYVDWGSPGMYTTVNVLGGGDSLNPGILEGYNDSRLAMSGGYVDLLDVYDNSSFTMSGGQIASLWGLGNSHISINNGFISELYAYNSQITISGGWINEKSKISCAQMTITGGRVDNFIATGNVTMSDGFIGDHFEMINHSQMIMTGGRIGPDIQLEDTSKLEFYGSSFSIDGVPVGYGNITSLSGSSYDNEPFRRLTGTLQNGDIFNNQFRIGESAQIVLVPEPTTFLLLMLGAFTFMKQKSN